MQILSLNGFEALCVARGVERNVSLFMLHKEEFAVGDHVLVHVGYAIQKISPEDAASTWEVLDEALALESAVQES
jgi:hydrogenase expression/formation protein HypC